MHSSLEAGTAANYLAALAQISAGLVAVLIAGVTAYFVFLQDRSAAFEERIQQHRIEIRSLLTQMRASWPAPASLFLPLELGDTYRSGLSDRIPAKVAQAAATDLLMGGTRRGQEKRRNRVALPREIGLDANPRD